MVRRWFRSLALRLALNVVLFTAGLLAVLSVYCTVLFLLPVLSVLFFVAVIGLAASVLVRWLSQSVLNHGSASLPARVAPVAGAWAESEIRLWQASQRVFNVPAAPQTENCT